MTIGTIKEFGSPLLRQKARQITPSAITSEKTKKIIADLKRVCDENKYGVGIAAPQIGISLAVMIIAIKPTPSRPGRDAFDKVVINPQIKEYIGKTVQLWDGCLSSGTDPVFAQTERYKELKVSYYDETGHFHDNEVLTGFIAHVFQHETDHLNGILFVDRITNSKSWMSNKEYVRMMAKKSKG